MVISDMSVPGCPLVHLNKAFSDLTGYQKDKIGTNCKFLQVSTVRRGLFVLLSLELSVVSVLRDNQHAHCDFNPSVSRLHVTASD